MCCSFYFAESLGEETWADCFGTSSRLFDLSLNSCCPIQAVLLIFHTVDVLSLRSNVTVVIDDIKLLFVELCANLSLLYFPCRGIIMKLFFTFPMSCLVFVSSTATLLSYRPDEIVTVFYVLDYDIDGGIGRVLFHLICESTSELVWFCYNSALITSCVGWISTLSSIHCLEWLMFEVDLWIWISTVIPWMSLDISKSWSTDPRYSVCLRTWQSSFNRYHVRREEWLYLRIYREALDTRR